MLSWLSRRFGGDGESANNVNDNDEEHSLHADENDDDEDDYEYDEYFQDSILVHHPHHHHHSQQQEDDSDDQEVTVTDMRNNNYKIQDNYDPSLNSEQSQHHLLKLRRPRSTSNSSAHSGSSSTTISTSALEDSNLTRNPFTDLHVLNTDQTQKDIITKMIPLFNEPDAFYNLSIFKPNSSCLIASCSDDGSIVVWNVNSGKKVFVCTGHRLPVKCITMIRKLNTRQQATDDTLFKSHFKEKYNLSNYILVSGSSDKTIKLWDMSDGKCIQTLSEHTASVKCICELDDGTFCSAGNDSMIHVWNIDGELLGSIERRDDENIHQLLALSNNRVVAASDNSIMYVYDTVRFTALEVAMKEHKDSVQCLVKLSDKDFASASIDGAIYIWDSTLLQCVRKLNEPIAVPVRKSSAASNTSADNDQQTSGGTDNNQPDMETLTNEITAHQPKLRHVRHLSIINSRYLSAAIGKGIFVYDLDTAQCVFKVEDAHEADVVKVISLHNGSVLVSCSDDGMIKIWNTYAKFPAAPSLVLKHNSSTTTPTSGTTTPHTATSSPRLKDKSKQKQQQQQKIHPSLIGELPLHTEAVHDLLPISPYSFASCGADRMILIWKDCRLEKRIRSFYAFKYHNMHYNNNLNGNNGGGYSDSGTGTLGTSLGNSPYYSAERVRSAYPSFSPKFLSPLFSPMSSGISLSDPSPLARSYSTNDVVSLKKQSRRL
jgi:WD40 repeat protein